MGFTTIWSASATSLIYIGCLAMCLLIPVTYLTCVMEGNCPVFLPTISNTWVYPPGNYLSRWFVGNLCDMFAVFQLIIYWDNVTYAQKEGSRVRGSISFEALLSIAWFAIFCLSWVGAICDDSSAESCRGNNTIHTTCAVTFFVLYDVYMLAQNYKNPDRTTCGQWVTAVLSCVLFLRFFLSAAFSDTALAVIEWTNVAIIVHWTINYPMSESLTSILRWGGISCTDVEREETVLSYINSVTMMKWINGLFIFTLGGCYIAGIIKGTLPTDRVPFISDMWVYPPGNWFSRWGVVQATHWGYPLMAFLMYSNVDQTKGRSLSNKALLTISEVAMFGLSIVGICNEDENITIHTIGAMAFFIGMDIYMICTALDATFKLSETAKASSSSLRRWAPLLVTIIALVAQFVRYVMDGDGLGSLPAILEWTNALMLITFINIDVFTRSDMPENISALFESSAVIDARRQQETNHKLKMKLLEGTI